MNIQRNPIRFSIIYISVFALIWIIVTMIRGDEINLVSLFSGVIGAIAGILLVVWLRNRRERQ